jgi:hypothetical protein
MALVVADRVQETSTTSGTGTLTLSGAVVGFQTFSTAIGNGNTTFYTIYDANVYDWEVGIGTVGAGTLARTTVLSNSAGTTSPISFAANAKFVFCTYPAEKSINYDANGVATIGEVLGYSDTGIVGSFTSTVAGYNQVIVQNKSTATNASSNLNVSNDAGTAGSNYAELGINSSTFTGSGSFNIAGASYVASASTDLTLGTYGAYNVHFVTNSSTTDAMTIYNNGGISLGTFGNPGIGNMAASKFVPGYSAITSAAGTTVLTADSNYYQNLLGSTTQTFQLPDATTLLEGTTFIFDNDSSGTLTVVDNATGPIETVPGGASGFVYLADNGTVAGTWRRHAFLPASYDFNATTANFGTATITNATWNGNTIGTAYGGTGLTTFAAANYALYSTDASTLVAGTLPTAAGGTALTSYATGDIIYASATNTLSKLAAGTNGYILTLASGVPSWAASTAATTRTVSTFTATASQTTFTVSYTVGLIDVFRNGVKLAETDYTATNGTTVVLNTGANAGDTVETVAYSSLSIGTGVTSFSTGTTGLTPTSGSGNITLAGTLNVANGGTGVTTSTGTGNVVLSTSPTIASPTFTSQATFAAGTVSLPAITTTGDTNTGIFFPTADTIAFSEGGVESMRIDSSGNVGIGTTSPAGAGRFLNIQGSASSSLIAGSTSNANFVSLYSGQTVDPNPSVLFNNSLRFGTATSPDTTGYAERMRIHASGGVSINNTSDPGAGNLTVTGTISDSKGDVRAAPINSKVAAYVLVANDAGQTISITTGGVTVNASIFSAGDMVTIFNNSGSSQNITQGASVTLRLTGTATTGTRALAQYGIATLLCVVGGATPTFACTGAGLT